MGDVVFYHFGTSACSGKSLVVMDELASVLYTLGGVIGTVVWWQSEQFQECTPGCLCGVTVTRESFHQPNCREVGLGY